MTVTTAPLPRLIASDACELRRFTVDQYYRMAAAGILKPEDKVELLDGVIVKMPPIGPEHGGAVNALNRLFKGVEDRAVITVQNPLRISEDWEPQPDLMLLRPRADLYRSAHPAPEDVLLLIEVADSSLVKDSRVKVPLYAAAEVPEVWLVDLASRTVWTHRDPGEGKYGTIRRHTRGESIALSRFPDVLVTVADIVG